MAKMPLSSQQKSGFVFVFWKNELTLQREKLNHDCLACNKKKLVESARYAGEHHYPYFMW
jgi:hypothetical protein